MKAKRSPNFRANISMNVAVKGGYIGFPTSETPFPQTMLVDWVRVYQERN